jgi:hypothetical protein
MQGLRCVASTDEKSVLCTLRIAKIGEQLWCRPYHLLASGRPRQSSQGSVPVVVNTRAFGQKLWHLYVHFVRTSRMGKARIQGSWFVPCARVRFRETPSVVSSVLMPLISFLSVPGPLPNPSIERTSPGKPGAASHLER